VINDTQLYELIEQQPLLINADQLPVKITAKNGFHFSKPFFVTQQFNGPLYIDIGCEADNSRLWGGVLISAILFAIFFATHVYIFMLLANFPLLYLVYKFFLRPKEFITIERLKLEKRKE
jgi:hypothetical protein